MGLIFVGVITAGLMLGLASPHQSNNRHASEGWHPASLLHGKRHSSLRWGDETIDLTAT